MTLKKSAADREEKRGVLLPIGGIRLPDIFTVRLTGANRDDLGAKVGKRDGNSVIFQNVEHFELPVHGFARKQLHLI